MTEIRDDDGAMVGRGGRLGRRGLAAPTATDGGSRRQTLLGRPCRIRSPFGRVRDSAAREPDWSKILTKLAQITTTMVSIDLEQLLQYAKRVEGQTVVLTGRLPALSVGSVSAKVVIGNVNGEAASKVVKEIRELGGTHQQCINHCPRLDATTWRPLPSSKTRSSVFSASVSCLISATEPEGSSTDATDAAERNNHYMVERGTSRDRFCSSMVHLGFCLWILGLRRLEFAARIGLERTAKGLRLLKQWS
ncbi:hypothetical protein B0H14DRAFT_2628353 [Mycena olivaceomarginata]|nr:hypothetical protein B0H14DRAFT_2628353 [Mycena olivaceomarginata]